MKEKENKCVSPHRLGIVSNKEISHYHKSQRGEPRREEGYGVGISEIDRAQDPKVPSSSGEDGRECGITSENEAHKVVREFVEKCGEEIPEGKEGSPFYKARDHEEGCKDEEGFLLHPFKDKEVCGRQLLLPDGRSL